MTNQVPILKQILPFVKTPSNLAIQAVEMTPLGIVGKNFDNFTGASRDAVRIAEVRGRVAVGTSNIRFNIYVKHNWCINWWLPSR